LVKIRFKDDEGREFPEWEETTLGSISNWMVRRNNIKNTNVLTVSAQQGLVSQLDSFNKSVAGKDLSGYYLLHKNDFAYRTMVC
jgi:type I restriction enzyme S subunit